MGWGWVQQQLVGQAGSGYLGQQAGHVRVGVACACPVAAVVVVLAAVAQAAAGWSERPQLVVLESMTSDLLAKHHYAAAGLCPGVVAA